LHKSGPHHPLDRRRLSFTREWFKSEPFGAEFFRGELSSPPIADCAEARVARSGHTAKRAGGRESAVRRITQTCRHAVAGKLASRQLAAWVDGFPVGESEFRLLWELHTACADAGMASFDQAELADRLAVSAAQVSGMVERLRRSQLIARPAVDGDRRRQYWRLTAAGDELVQRIIAAVDASHSADDAGKEAA
jgi:DNA-binding MarR family transcriptional regulator